MSAHTLASTYYVITGAPGGDGLKFAAGTFTGTASYDTGGSALDLSSIFADKVYYCEASADNADFACKWVAGTSNASSDMKIFIDNDAGTEASSTDDLSSTPGTFEWFACGTDG